MKTQPVRKQSDEQTKTSPSAQLPVLAVTRGARRHRGGGLQLGRHRRIGGRTASSSPITIGMSLPMTGPVADVSKSGYQGYELWASQVNAAGGLLGRKVKLDMLDDGFDPNQTATDYTRLISQDHVDLLLGTFSSLLNAPASAIAARQGMLYVEPSGGAATLFTRGFTDLFFAQPGTTTSLPDQFVAWIASLPASERPATAAYVTQDDPSASPAVAVFRTRLEALGVKTVYYQVYDPSTTNFDSIASAIARAPQMIIQGRSRTTAPSSSGRCRSSTTTRRSSSRPTRRPMRPTRARSAAPPTPTASSPPSPGARPPAYPGNRDSSQAYTKMFGAPPTEDAANSYTAGQVLQPPSRRSAASTRARSRTGCTKTRSAPSSAR